jgi:hypothetical protein
MDCRKLNLLFDVSGPDFMEFEDYRKNLGVNGYSGVFNGFYNKQHSEETKKKISVKMKKICEDKEFCKSRAKYGKENGMYGKSRSGKLNPMYGKKHSDETKNKISIKAKNRKYFGGWHLSEERKKAISIRNSKEYILKSPDGKIITIKNLTQYCIKNNLNSIMMSRVARGKAICHKGYTKP